MDRLTLSELVAPLSTCSPLATTKSLRQSMRAAFSN